MILCWWLETGHVREHTATPFPHPKDGEGLFNREELLN